MDCVAAAQSLHITLNSQGSCERQWLIAWQSMDGCITCSVRLQVLSINTDFDGCMKLIKQV